jgi:hypothetical protein
MLALQRERIVNSRDDRFRFVCPKLPSFMKPARLIDCQLIVAEG